jgi:hypothetical protein
MSIDSSSSSSNSSSDSSSDNSGSDIDEEAIMDQVESELYHQRIARAWEIVNRRQAELDIEGIETGGVKSSDVEMGGTSYGLTN